MSRIIIALLLIFAAGSLPAQQVMLKLKDASGEALPGVAVKLLKGGPVKESRVGITDADGLVTLDIPAYPAQLEITDFRYKSLVKILDKAPAETVSLTLEQSYTGLNEVVVTGVGRPTRLDEAVSVYRIITAADFRAQGAVNLQEALRNQMGINIAQDQALGGNINMRALSGSNVKIMIDGLPLNGREGSNIDLGQFNLANIERIEVVQGPMSVMYGSDAIGGVINLITKTNEHAFQAGGNAFYESIGKYNFGADVSRIWKKHNLSLNLARNLFQGWDPKYDTLRNPLWKPKEQYTGNLKYTYKLSDDASLTYGMDLTTEKLVIKGAIPDPYNEFNRTTADAYYRTTRFINRLQLKWKTGANGYWESNNSYALYHRTRTTYITDLPTAQRKLSEVAGDQSVNSFDDITSRTTYNNKVGIVNYTFGYDMNLEFAKGVEKIKDGNKSMGDYAVFLTTDIRILPRLTIQPALRASYNSLYDAPLAPSFSFLYKPASSFQLRGAYSRGFRAPTLKELYLDFVDFNHDITGNADLKAEYSNHYQLSAGYTFFNKDAKSLLTTLTGFYDNVKDQIALRALPDIGPTAFTYANLGHTRIIVLQLNNEFRWKGLRVNLGGSYTKSIETVTGPDTVPSFHYFEVTGNARYDIPEWKAGVAVFYKFTGSQPSIGSIENSSLFSGRLQSYHNIDASVEKSFYRQRLRITAGIRNITNTYSIGSVVGGGSTGGVHGGGDGLNLTPGRSFFASLRIQLGR